MKDLKEKNTGDFRTLPGYVGALYNQRKLTPKQCRNRKLKIVEVFNHWRQTQQNVAF